MNGAMHTEALTLIAGTEDDETVEKHEEHRITPI